MPGKTQLALETVDMGDVVGLVQSVVGPLARRNGVKFTCDINPDVPLIQGDFEKIRHVLENLCGNAMKFTPEGGSVQAGGRVDAAAHEVVLTVIDTGIGIADKDQQRIFEQFVQVDSSVSRKYNRTGWASRSPRSTPRCTAGRLPSKASRGKVARLPCVSPRIHVTSGRTIHRRW